MVLYHYYSFPAWLARRWWWTSTSGHATVSEDEVRMTSLKAYTPRLARMLGTSQAALYERQRALVRAGLLDQSEGRGPGSGVRATASSVAWLLIAVMATSNLSDVEARARDIAAVRPNKEVRGETRARSFHEAITGVLASRTLTLLRPVAKLTVSHSTPYAEIHYAGGQKLTFASVPSRNLEPVPPLRILAEIDGEILRQIADDLTEMSDKAVKRVSSKKKTG